MVATCLLIAVCCVALLAIGVSVKAGFHSTMDRYLRIFLGFLFLHAAHVLLLRNFVEVEIQSANFVPYGLLYGPFLYFAYRLAAAAPLRKKALLLHALPFILFFGSYFLSLAVPSLFRGHERIVIFTFYGALSLSFVCYAGWALFFGTGAANENSGGVLRLISTMGVVLAFVAVVVSVFTYSSAATGPIRSQFKGSIVFFAMLAAAIVLFANIAQRAVGRLSGKDVTPSSNPDQ